MKWRWIMLAGGLAMILAATLLALPDQSDPAGRYCQVDTSQQGYWCSKQPVVWVPTGEPTR